VIGTDRGLCGGYNLELDGAARAFVRDRTQAGIDVRLLVKGSRTERILARTVDVPITGAGPWPRAGVTAGQVQEMFDATSQAFLSGEVDEVWACYATFLSSISREPKAVRLLPVQLPEVRAGVVVRYFYEPDRETPLQELLDVLARLQVEDAMLEAFASEQAARMVTMQEANERADKTLADLQIRYNRVRRESITSDLTGIMVSRRLRSERDHVTA
jgi:F-type H+-transporting ATPase subunit gamma